jgi:hypothetical protein
MQAPLRVELGKQAFWEKCLAVWIIIRNFATDIMDG